MEVNPKSRSAQEIVDLWSYISDRLEKNFRRTIFSAPAMAQNVNPGFHRPGGNFGRRVVGS
jgi:chromosome partitioning protein